MKPLFLAGAKRAALYVGWSQARRRQAPNTKLSITRSFFELQSPDFAWKFIWTVRTNTRNTRNIRNTRNTRNQKYQKNQKKIPIKNSPAPAINTQKEKKSQKYQKNKKKTEIPKIPKKRKNRNTKKKTLRRHLLIHKKRKKAKRATKFKKCTCAPAISTSYFFSRCSIALPGCHIAICTYLNL